MDYLECRIADTCAVPHCSLPSELGEAAFRAAREMGERVLAALSV
jgi:hypothetical protein